VVQSDFSGASGALLLVGLWSDELQRLRGTIERLGTGQRREIAGWEELLLAMQQFTPGILPAAAATLDRQSVLSVLERLAMWYTAQSPQDRLILSRLLAARSEGDVRAFDASTGEPPALMEPDELIQLASLITDADLTQMRRLLRRARQ
jgi:hypothetical protein